MIFRKSTFNTAFYIFFIVLLQYQVKAQPELLVINISNGMGVKGSKVCLDVTMENFENLTSIQMNMSYDATLVLPECPATFVHPALQINSLTEFSCNNKDKGYIFYLWGGDKTSIPDGEVIFTICFDIIGEAGNKTPVFFNGQIIDNGIEICGEDSNGSTICTEEIISNPGTIMITSNTLQSYYHKCDADSDNIPNGGSLTFYGTGGLPPYSYTVMPGGYTGTLSVDGERFTINNISTGIYTLVITDANALSSTVTPISISDNIAITIDSFAIRNPTCADRSNGYINIKGVSGGISPYLFKWSNFISGIQLDSIGGLSSNTYSVTISDFNGCEKIVSHTLSVDTLRMNLQITRDASCTQIKDGSAVITAVGGTPWTIGRPYEFSLNGNNWIRFTPPHTINNLGSGNFTLTVKDSIFCDTDVTVYNMPFNRTVEMSLDITDAKCNGSDDGQIEITASPYSVDYTFLPLINFPNLGIIKTDTFKVAGIPAGNYAYRVLDAAGCKDTLFFTINEPDSLKINPTIVQPDCATTGSITLNPTGGTGIYTYKWDPVQAGNPNVLTGLNGGTYTVTVTDDNDCTATFTQLLNQQGSLNITPEVIKQISCAGANDATLRVDILSGNGPFDIIWRDTNGVQVGNSQTILNVRPGTYSVQVTDNTLCSNTRQITIDEPLPITFTSIVSNAPCFDTNGQAIINILGGSTGYTFEWVVKGSSTIIDTGNTLNSKAGEYVVTVINQFNCKKDTNLVITEPAKITFPVPQTRNVTCLGLSTGQAVILNAPGGLTYNWSSGSIGPFAINYAAGPGWVFATEGTCKSDTVFFTVGTFPALSIDNVKTIISNPTCFGENNGAVTIEAQGGTGLGYTYVWANGVTGATLNNIQADAYIVTIGDSNNCTQVDTFFLTQPDKLEASIDRIKTVELDCNNQDAGKVGFFTSGGNPGKKTFTWQSGVIVDGDVAVGLSPGTYCATISDNFGCKDTACYTLTAPAALRGELNTPDEPLCNGGTTCISVKFVTGGTGNKYTFQINNGTRYHRDSCVTVFAGQYFINLIDSAGCSIDTIITIGQPGAISVDLGPDREIQLGLPSPVINVSIDSPVGLDTLVWTPFTSINCLTTDCVTVEINPAETTTYLLTVTDRNGCTGTDDITIEVKDVRNVYFANIFTPNRDGNNDYFQAVTGPGVEKILSFAIFDRWGNRVFEKADFLPDPAGTDGWDGTFDGRRLDPGVYVYYAKALFIDGKEIEYSGSVTLADKVKN